MYKMFYNVHILCFFLEVKKWVGHPLQVTTNEWFRRHRRSSSRADWLVPAGLRDMKRIFKGMQWANCLIAFIACLQLVVFAHVHNSEVPRRWSSQEGKKVDFFSTQPTLPSIGGKTVSTYTKALISWKLGSWIKPTLPPRLLCTEVGLIIWGFYNWWVICMFIYYKPSLFLFYEWAWWSFGIRFCSEIHLSIY